jgi:hypothetical protein
MEAADVVRIDVSLGVSRLFVVWFAVFSLIWYQFLLRIAAPLASPTSRSTGDLGPALLLLLLLLVFALAPVVMFAIGRANAPSEEEELLRFLREVLEAEEVAPETGVLSASGERQVPSLAAGGLWTAEPRTRTGRWVGQ